MSYTNELLDRLRAQHNLTSDYQLARLLAIRPNRVSNYRTGVSHADDKTAVILAESLGLDPLETIARVNMDRATDRKDKAFWRRLASSAAVVTMLAVLPYSTRASDLEGHQAPDKMHYAKWRRILHALRAALRTVRGSTSTERQDDATALLA